MIQVISSNGTQYNTGKIFILDKYGKLKVPSGTSGSGTVTSIATTAPITGGTITTYGTIGITQATTTTDGYLSSTDWNTFNNKFDTPSGTTAEYVRGDGSLATLPTSGGIPKGTAAGTDTYTTTITGVTSYVDGNAYLIRFTNGNTTDSTLNINSLGAITLYRNNDGPIVPGDILDGAEMLCVYNSSTPSFQCIGTSPNTLLSYVTNDDTVTITKGQPVYASGGVGDRLKVKLAYNTGDSTSAQTIGLVFSNSIAAGQQGIIITQGLLTGLNILDTSTWADSDPVYLGPTAGTITPTKPYAPNHLVYLGFVTSASNGNAGRLYVRVQNGYEMDELHNVQAQSPSLNDTLYYDSGVSPGQWKTASIATILGYTPANNSNVVHTTGNESVAGVKTFSDNQIISTTSTDAALRVTQLGTGEAIRVEDETNPDATPFLVTADGRVGIGLSSLTGTAHKLHVRLGLGTNNSPSNDTVAVFENSTHTYVSILSPDAQNAGIVYGSNSNRYGAFNTWNFANNTMLYGTAKTGAKVQFQTDNQQTRMTILSNGNVGIGDTNPAQNLSVTGIAAASVSFIAPTIQTTTLYPQSDVNLNIRTRDGGAGNRDIVFGTGNPSGVPLTRMTVKSAGNIGIGTTTPNASSLLDLTSTTQGFLPPRMTNAQMNVIASPPLGLMVYCTDSPEGLYINKSTGWTLVT